MAIDYGSVTINGETIKLTEQAQACNYGTNGDVRYSAIGIDSDGEKREVIWETTPAWTAMQQALRDGVEPARNMPDPNDESMACDWDNPISCRIL